MGWWTGRAMASSRESEKPQSPGNNRAEYGRHFHISSIFLPRQHPPGKENPATPSTWLSPSLERGRREASRATRARSRAHSLPCQHPLPRHLSSDGPSAWKSSRRRKDRARQPEQTQAHPGALAIPRGGSEARAVQGDLGGRARRSGQVTRCSGSAW